MSPQTSLAGSDAGGETTAGGTGERLRKAFVSGVALTLPAIVTVILLVFALDFVLGLVRPAVGVVAATFGVDGVSSLVLEVGALATLLALILVVGFVAEARPGGGIERTFDSAVGRIPGVGSVYSSFNEMSQLLLDSDSQSFREVKMVEFPTQGSYTIAFVTADTPEEFRDAADHDEMTTLFMPMAPNPVMGGFVLHVSSERVYDVDLTVEEGIRSIVTSGVTVGGDAPVESDIGEVRPVATDAHGAER